MTKIVWNGCDSYVEADEAVQRGYDFDGEKLFHINHEFTTFEVVEINPADLPIDNEGEPDFNNIFGCESGKFYKLLDKNYENGHSKKNP